MEKKIPQDRGIMVSKCDRGVPTGKIIPMYLGDDGNVYTMRFHSLEQIELMQALVAGLLDNKIVIDVEHPINDLKKGKIELFDTTKIK